MTKSLEEFMVEMLFHMPDGVDKRPYRMAMRATMTEALRVCEEWKKRNDTEDGVIDFLKSWAGEATQEREG